MEDWQRNAANPDVVATIAVEIERIRSLDSGEVRALWRKTFKRDVPKALTRDLQVRMLAWNIQEQAFGGHDRATQSILKNYARGRPANARMIRRLMPGTELVREYQGERHTVTIVAEGYRWRDGVYPSLSAIARAITGSAWNGPRFFGLRTGPESRESARTPSGAGTGANGALLSASPQECPG